MIMHLPHGYELPSSQRMVSTSPGTETAETMARAMLGGHIAEFCCDEATSNVDLQTENADPGSHAHLDA